MISGSARHLSADRGTKELFSLLMGPNGKTLFSSQDQQGGDGSDRAEEF